MSFGGYHPDEQRGFHGRWVAGMERIKSSLGGLHHDEARAAIMNGHALDTSRLYGGKGGKDYDPARTALHKLILEKFMSEGVARPGGSRPTAIFTAGGPASGKSGLAGKDEKHPERNLPVPKGHVYINPDAIKEHLPEYKMLQDAGRDDIAASAVHEESSHIAKLLTAMAAEHNMPLVVDGVGDSEYGKFAGKIKGVQGTHDVTVRYAHVPVEEAIKREVARSETSGRKVDHNYLRKAHGRVSSIFKHEIRHMPGVRSEIYDTNTAGRPSLIGVRDERGGPRAGARGSIWARAATTGGSGVHAINRPKYDEFLRKGHLAVARGRRAA